MISGVADLLDEYRQENEQLRGRVAHLERALRRVATERNELRALTDAAQQEARRR